MVIQARERWIIASLALVAVMLAASPWLFGFADAIAPLVSATVLALILAAAAFLARWHRFSHASSVALAAGAWSMLSPFLWGFWNIGAAFWSHLAAGAAAILLSVREVELEQLTGSAPGVDPKRQDNRTEGHS